MITLQNLKDYATKLNAQLDTNLPNIGVYMPQTKSQEKDNKSADFLYIEAPYGVLDLNNFTIIYQFMKDWETFHSLKSTIKKKQIEQFIRHKISTDDRWALRTLILMYQKQTVTEKQSEKTVENNHVGFTGFDSKLMTSFAKQYLSRAKQELDSKYLSKKQMDIVKKTMQKYWKQVYDNSDEFKLLKLVAQDIQKTGQQLSLNI